MKRFLASLALLVVAATVRAAEPEQIYQFDSQILVQANGTLAVTETIRVQAAGQQIQHGIYRDFPQLYHTPRGLRSRTGFVVQKVLRDGQPEDHHLANRDNGVRVYIGSANVFVPPGVHTYQLTYTTDRQLGFFKDHDELYWNVTGNGWIFPINNVTCTVILPPGATVKNLTAYTGYQGARGNDFTATNLNDRARFTTTRKLFPSEGFTAVVEWPKGFVAPPTLLARLKNLLKDNHGLALALAGLLITLGYYFAAWRAVGRDPKRGIIIPRYTPPPDFSPAAVRYLWRMGYDNKVLTATVMNLAVQGALKIVERKSGVFGQKVYSLVPVPHAKCALSPGEEIVRRELVGDGLPITLRQDNYVALQAAQSKLRTFLAESVKNQFFKGNLPQSLLGFAFCLASLACLWLDLGAIISAPDILVPGGFFIASVVAVVLGRKIRFGVGAVAFGGLLAAAAFTVWFARQPVAPVFLPIILGTLAGTFHFLLKAYTPAGRDIMDEIEGFKLYLGVAEKDRLNLENPPERTPQLFEQFLPFALALGVEQKWSEQFASILAAAGTMPGQNNYSPAWYAGDSWNTIGATSFAAAIGTSLAGAISSASTTPGSSSGGSSGGGSSSGGSSGGGGGGGGGGGW